MSEPEQPRYTIERKQLVLSASGGVDKWVTWSRHETAEDRAAALVRLADDHPTWHLREYDEPLCLV